MLRVLLFFLCAATLSACEPPARTARSPAPPGFVRQGIFIDTLIVDADDADVPGLARKTFGEIEDDERVALVAWVKGFLPESDTRLYGAGSLQVGNWELWPEVEVLPGSRLRVTITLRSYISGQRFSATQVLDVGQRLVLPTTLASTRGHVAVILRPKAVLDEEEYFDAARRRGLVTEDG